MRELNFIDRTLSKIAQKRGFQVVPVSEYKPDFNSFSSAGININHDTALKFSAVFSAIRIRSENIASLPKTVVKQTGAKKEVLFSHPVQRLISRKPNSYMNAFVFWELMNAYVDGWGNSYAIIERDSFGDPSALWPILPNNIIITLIKGELYYKVLTGDHAGTYAAFEILHFKLFTKDGMKGIDPISNMAQAIGVGLAAERFNAEFFEKGGHIRGVYETDQSLGDEEYNAVSAAHLNAAKNFETPLLEYGIKYKQITISPEAAQMIQQRTFTIQDIARIFVLPPHMLAEQSRSTFSNIEHQDIQFVKYSIRPSVKRYESEIEDKLFFDGEKDLLDTKFNLEGLLRGDTQTRSQFYHNAILDGWMNRNEVRSLENLDNGPEELDEYLYPSNMNLADLLIGQQKQQNQSNNQNIDNNA
jgi:HK97 family phage portal protein